MWFAQCNLTFKCKTENCSFGTQKSLNPRQIWFFNWFRKRKNFYKLVGKNSSHENNFLGTCLWEWHRQCSSLIVRVLIFSSSVLMLSDRISSVTIFVVSSLKSRGEIRRWRITKLRGRDRDEQSKSPPDSVPFILSTKMTKYQRI